MDEGGSFSSLLFDGTPKPLFNIKDVLIGVSGLIAIFATAWRYKLHEIENLLKTRDAEIKERDSTINDSKRLDDQFAKAVELLKEDNDITVRRGGVYILKNLAIKSPQHLQQCIDLLCSLNNWMGSALQQDKEFFLRVDRHGKQWRSQNFELNLEDVQSQKGNGEQTDVSNYEKSFRNKQIISLEVLKVVENVIVNYSIRKKDVVGILDLSGYNLCNMVLRDIDLEGWVKFNYTNLHASRFSNVKLNKLNFTNANLSFCSLFQCSAKETVLSHSQLVCAKLFEVDLRCAKLRHTNSVGIDLYNVELQGADLRDSDFRAAFFDLVQMQGADMEILHVGKNFSMYTKTNFNGVIFNKSCITGAVFNELAQEIYYLNHTDKWKGAKISSLLTEYDWSEEAHRNLTEAWERYIKFRDELIKRLAFYQASNLKLTSNVQEICTHWLLVSGGNRLIIDKFKKRFDNYDEKLNNAFLDELKTCYLSSVGTNQINNDSTL
ncbi:pentapeptide repeat-containing protein [Spirosoma oryzicola]|uniref:pentapeptide repeat-containing protein n=1 Tax=Spirosoma oryzicola TaxID=2898794 RepID=UPI001E43B58D|nr:pentapeptide repeat-containing protein [Spirosoma oryzicola]UHG93241.1 pentapeptide repeat-containing protein [Spirosoma oryzicola]